MSQFKLRLQNIFKEIYPHDKIDASSLQTNLNDLSIYTAKNAPFQNQNTPLINNNDASFLTNSTITTAPILKKSPSMKKLKELSTQFGIDTQRTVDKLNQDKSFYNESSLNNSFYSITNKKNTHRRNSSNSILLTRTNNSREYKRSSSLKDKLITTGTRSTYIPRSNSKIMKNISYIKQEIESGNKNSSNNDITAFIKKTPRHESKGSYIKERKNNYNGINLNLFPKTSSNRTPYNIYTNNNYVLNNHNKTNRMVNQTYTYITGVPRNNNNNTSNFKSKCDYILFN
jgi:hypothetical protein